MIPYEKILKETLKEGGEFADLFFEQVRSVAIICEEDRIEKVISGLDMGVGLRILHGGKTFYGFTNQISEESLLHLARRLSEATKEDKELKVINLVHRDPSSPLSSSSPEPVSPIEKHPKRISIGEKVSVVKRGNGVARKLTPMSGR